jgi:glycosyltransferase involved in cell wall biosynthesis
VTNEQSAAPKVSVLMTCYNAASTIEESVRSVLAQTFTDFELVLVDNCSTDESISIVQKIADPRIRLVALDKNHGRTPALNIALNNARGQYIAILDADDTSTSDRFQLQVDRLDQDSELVLIASWYRNIDAFGELVNAVETPTEHIDLVRRLASNCPFMNSAVMFRADSIRALGGYDETFEYSQDLALWLGLATLGRFEILPNFLTNIRLTPTSLTNLPSYGFARTHDAYILYKQAQGLEGLRIIDRLRGQRTIGLYGLLYAWRSLRAKNIVRAVGLTITNFWAIPIALFELLRKGLKFFKPIK